MSATFLTVAQVADRWSCHRGMAYDEIRAGRLQALSLGTNRTRISSTELARFERDRTGGTK